ncbi:MAG: integrase arm-type DNA-binding domain-containing protein [Rhodobacteraceae bacterium]|nr:integrase arm-type DNA-binding domain-containing protein [Paracoccaceae bacterium]
MKTNLTDTFIRSIKPPQTGYAYYFDIKSPGLRLRVSFTGAMAWVIQKKVKGGRRIHVTLGSYPAVSLKAAREQAYIVQAEAENGIDRIEAAKRETAAKQAEVLTARSLLDILEVYIATHIEQNLKPGNSRQDRIAQLRCHLDDLKEQPIAVVSRAQLQSIVDAKAAEGKIVMANRIRAALTAFFGWAEKRGHIDANPAERVQKAGKERVRTRTPSIEEVREIWAATFEQGTLWGAFLRLCILTGQRSRSDVAAMRWEWIDWHKSRYCIPNPKNGQPHIVHLSPPAMTEILALRPNGVAPATGLVLSTTGSTPLSGFAKPKARLDATVNGLRQKAGRPPMLEWRLHDLRRSQATALAEAGVDEGVVDRIQNHVAVGSRASAVAGVYNRAQKLPERAKALDLWAEMVLGQRAVVMEGIFADAATKTAPQIGTASFLGREECCPSGDLSRP